MPIGFAVDIGEALSYTLCAIRCSSLPQCFNSSVEVDDRGFIYIVDRANTGMHILELTGAARKVANFGRPPSH